MQDHKKKAKYYLWPAAISVLIIFGIIFYYFFCTFSKSNEDQVVYVDADDTPDSVYTKLAAIANDSQLTGFRTLARHNGYEKNIRTGRYVITPSMNTFTVFRHMKNGQQQPMMLTIPEARTAELLAGRLSQKLMLDSLELVQALTSEEVCKKYGYDTATIVAMFVPNTYEVYWDMTLEKLMQRMQKEHDAFWTDERQKKAQRLGLTPNEVATLASIVDEETANTTEKPMIAGMYLNRLKTGMPLQADPTVKFALKDFNLKRIYHNHLSVESPYNTYAHIGLPPGPIKVASIKGIDAVLNRQVHDFLYMCANSDFSGTHVFARNYQEHLHNAALYAKALNERGIK
ncbi:MAG: endolytic transglycosylase MltG [Prevotella sp.]|nr:endolytic transglycosylase MltG [Prevotella sp.]